MKSRTYWSIPCILFTSYMTMGCEAEVKVTEQSTSSSASSNSSSSGNGGEGGASSGSSSSGNGGAGNGGAGGSGGGSGLCNELAPIKLTASSIQDTDQNGQWTPGESALVNVIMTNTSVNDINYPGIRMESDHPDVTTAAPYNALFLIGGQQMAELGVTFDAAPSVAPGTIVTFTVTLHNIMNESCPDLPQLVTKAKIE